MKVIDPKRIMSLGAKPLTKWLAMELANVDLAFPYLARQLSVFDTSNAPRGVSRDAFGVARSA